MEITTSGKFRDGGNYTKLYIVLELVIMPLKSCAVYRVEYYSKESDFTNGYDSRLPLGSKYLNTVTIELTQDELDTFTYSDYENKLKTYLES